MKKTDLIATIAEGAGISKVAAKAALETALATIAGAVKANDKVILPGFGTFSAATRAARTGFNPRTGEKIEIAAKTTMKFKASAGVID
jgi:DNA-binding protein HU-beta